MKIRHVDVIVLAAPGNYGLTPDGAESHGPSILLQEDPESLAQFIELGSDHRCPVDAPLMQGADHGRRRRLRRCLYHAREPGRDRLIVAEARRRSALTCRHR